MHKYQPNPEQQKIINHINGAILVLAPVGTGKTFVLSERVARAINNGISIEKILCLTFTNRAAKEMSERLWRMYPEEFRQITIKTFHGLCAQMLRIEAKNIGLPADFVIYDDSDCKEIIKEVFGYQKNQDIQRTFFDIAKYKSQACAEELSFLYPTENIYQPLGLKFARKAIRYQSILQERHAIDFADLVFFVRAMLLFKPEISQRWQERFDFVQVDEVQDTHICEYEIVRHLVLNTKNLATIGDLDQTIYEWRGSEPDLVIQQFTQDFQPTKYSLTFNYRATQTLLNAASSFADSFEQRKTQITPALSCKPGKLIQTHFAENEQTEALWIGEQIQKLAANNQQFPYNRVAILTRTHKRIEIISQVLEQLNIPCITIEQYQFFMRQEVKDALAYLRLILNPFDTASFRRVLLRPSRGIGNRTIQNVINEGEKCGFHLTDMSSTQTFVDGDPFSNLICAYKSGIVVVFDVETTGLSVTNDEVIEIAALKLVNGKVEAEFHQHILNTVSVGDSQHIHGYTDQELAEKGKPANQVFSEFFEFVQNAFLVGHNVGFDIKMVTAHASKAGITIPKFQWGDTWNLANRFINSDSYSLENLAKKLGLPDLPTHKALDDTRTTVELLQYLIPKIESKSDHRQALVYRYGEEFESLAEQIEMWRNDTQKFRPADLLEKLLMESGLQAYYQTDPQRENNLLQLINIFKQKDQLEINSDTALRSILEFTALAKNLDQISQQDNQVMIITIHQSKGLEFDNIFIAGASQEEFPSFLSLRNDNLEEEKRLFYVAMTRAKQKLFISGFLEDSRGYSKFPSQFIDSIADKYLQPE